MNRVLRSSTLGLAVSVTVALALLGPVTEAQTATETDFRIGAQSRQRVAQLNTELKAILSSTLPTVRELYANLDTYLGALERPETLATPETKLRGWGEADVVSYKAVVDVAFDEVHERLSGIYDVAVATAAQRAQSLAGAPSPLDGGDTGDTALDLALTAFEETMRGAVGLSRLDNMRQEYRNLETEIVQTFTSFGDEGAQEMLDGRLLVFIGGNEVRAPRCMIAYRNDSEHALAGYRLVQVVRHRVMRGNAIVHDLGWRPMPGTSPGYPAMSVHDNYLVAEAVEPLVRTDAPGYDNLRDSRVIVDIQSGVLGPSGQLLGSVDWRIDYYVSGRGDLAWQPSDRRPVFDPYGTEIKRVLLGEVQ